MTLDLYDLLDDHSGHGTDDSSSDDDASTDDSGGSSGSDSSGDGEDDTFVIIDGVAVPLREDGSISDDRYIRFNGIPYQLHGEGRPEVGLFNCSDNDDEAIGTDLREVFYGRNGNDSLRGRLGADSLYGEDGDDSLFAGNGSDYLNGGRGADHLYGGFGANTFASCADGVTDYLHFKSDQFAVNPLYGRSGLNADGQRTDIIGELDSRDAIYVEGVVTAALSFHSVTQSVRGSSFTGIGIFANGVLEAIYVGSALSASDLQGMTFGA